MDKIYQEAKDKNIEAVVLYADSNNKLYIDAAATATAATKEFVEELFKKDMLIVKDGDDFFAPTKLVMSSTKAVVSVVDFAGSPAAAALVSFETVTA